MGFFERVAEQLKDTAKAFSPVDALGQVKHAGENIFGFYSPTGGNGTTTLVANIADALRVAKQRVAVVDLDIMHPQLFRYLSNQQEEPPRSLADKWIDPTAGLSEFSAISLDGFIAVFSMRTEDDVYVLAEFDRVAISQFLQEVSMIYDFVLIDMHGDLNKETVVASMEACTEIFTIIRPTVGDLECVYKDNLCAYKYNIGARFTNIIQAPVHSLTLGKQEFDELNDLPWKMVTNIPYVNSVSQVGQNYGLFATSTIGTDAPAVAYRQAVKFLAETLLNYHGSAPATSEPAGKETVEWV